MPVLPSRLQDLIQFLDMHAPQWTTHAAGIGLTPAQATAFAASATAAHNAFAARLAAEEASRAATLTLQTAVRDARRAASDAIRSIKAYAELQAKPEVIYNLALIPPPATPTPMPPPGQPVELTVALRPGTGALELRWKATNPRGAAGTTYIIRRREEGQEEFTFAGSTGRKLFVDSGFRRGPDQVAYTVQGQRGSISGLESEIFVINFGSGGGQVTATVARLAA